MYDVLRNVLPWTMIAIAVVVFAAYGIKPEKIKPKKKRKNRNSRYAIKKTHAPQGMYIGLIVGAIIVAAFDGTTFLDIATGASVGMLAGIGVGLLLKKD